MAGWEDPMTSVGRAATLAAWLFAAAAAQAGSVEGIATVGERPAAGAVVYLEASRPAPPPAAPARVVMDQKNLAFLPRVLPVARGTVVEFTNSDDVQHNVFSPSAIAGKFNLGTYGPGAARTVTLDQPGDVLVLCNIHMEMEAHILVLDGPYFATTGDDGRYRIADVPAGAYTVKLWQGRWQPVAHAIDLPDGGALHVDLSAAR
jgi:plastocyanin